MIKSITIKERQANGGRGWDIIPTPTKLTEQIALMETLVGRDVVIEIVTDATRSFFCGTPEVQEIMRKHFPGFMVIEMKDAVIQIQETPDVLCNTLQVFSPAKGA